MAVIDWSTTFDSWYEQFIKEHGYRPEEDPNLLAKGFSPKEALAEHMRAAEWGAMFAAKEGRKPTQYEWESSFYKTYYGYDPREVKRQPAEQTFQDLFNQKEKDTPIVFVPKF